MVISLGASGEFAEDVPDDIDHTFAGPTSHVYVGQAGDVKLKTGALPTDYVTFYNVPQGVLLPISATGVLTDGTSAAKIVAFKS